MQEPGEIRKKGEHPKRGEFSPDFWDGRSAIPDTRSAAEALVFPCPSYGRGADLKASPE